MTDLIKTTLDNAKVKEAVEKEYQKLRQQMEANIWIEIKEPNDVFKGVCSVIRLEDINRK